MEKHIVRREFLKLKNKDISYRKSQKILEEKFGEKYTTRTLKNWRRRHNTTEWDTKNTTKCK
jgi:hypothetical protein